MIAPTPACAIKLNNANDNKKMRFIDLNFIG
jgi:hypothetical protein